MSSLAAAGAASWHIFSVADVPVTSKVTYFVLFASLVFCAIAYQINRVGAAIRRTTPSASRGDVADLLEAQAPRVTVLVPTYREERRVLQMTVLSAALARYGNRHIVVLVDDPPDGNSRLQSLQAVEDIRQRVAEVMEKLRAEADDIAGLATSGGADPSVTGARLSSLYICAAEWLEELARDLGREASVEFAHVDRFFAEDVVLGLATTYRDHSAMLAASTLTLHQIESECARLAVLFCDDIAVFERKSFSNLSHAASKAMNLNSYLGLVGACYDVHDRGGKWILARNDQPDAAFEVQDADYFLTLDADSVVRPTYLLELVEIAQAMPEAGVVQTPYLTFPDATSPVERIAGATTDIQYLVHQGSSLFGAAHWVGANALLRKTALDDICVTEHDGTDWRRIFVQDRTVIEDTGSTLDLLGHGWIVHNHFKPLAFSATPADFGSLAIQRQRWSNGGLIIFPSLWRHYLASGKLIVGLPGFLLRTHYLLSPLIGNLAVLLLMVLLLADARELLVTSLAMAPYFLLYGYDLSRIGYRFRDLFAVSSLNIMLLPVSLAGVAASLVQLATGRKSAFARTPKVAGRTAVHPIYILFNIGMFVLMLFYVQDGIANADVAGAIVPGVNVLLYGYGLWRFIGIKDGALDLARPIAALFRRRPAQVKSRPRVASLGILRTLGAALIAVGAVLAPTMFNNGSVAGAVSGPTYDFQSQTSIPANLSGLTVPGVIRFSVGERQKP